VARADVAEVAVSKERIDDNCIKNCGHEMTILLLWGYAVSTVAILITFSITNQRAGWKRSRIAPADILDDRRADSGQRPSAPLGERHSSTGKGYGVFFAAPRSERGVE
jgi:hypothetical protein